MTSIDRTHVKTGSVGGPDNWQTRVRGLQKGQVVLLTSTHCGSTLLCYGRIHHRVRGCRNEGMMGRSGVGRGDEGERTHS